MIITIDGKPQGKGRPRFTRNGHTYTPPQTKAYEDKIRWAWRGNTDSEKLNGNIQAEIIAVFEPPKSISKKKQAELIGEPCDKKPDIDNIVKICLDALNGCAFEDDKQVVSLSSCKVYGLRNAVTIVLKEVNKCKNQF